MKKILINIKNFFGNIFDSIFYSEQSYIYITYFFINRINSLYNFYNFKNVRKNYFKAFSIFKVYFNH